MTIRTTGFGASVARKRAQTCVSVWGASPEPRAEQRHGGSLDVPEDRDESEAGADERGQREQERRSTSGSAAAERAAHDRRRADRAARGADEAADRIGNSAGHKSDRHCSNGSDRGSGQRPSQGAGARNADRRAEAREDPDRIPGAHAARLHTRRSWAEQDRFCGRHLETGVNWMSHDARPLLVFFSSARSGPSRRMESLVAHIARKERTRLRVVQVDVEERADLAEKLAVSGVPALVLVVDRKPVARLEGRVSAPAIEAMVEAHVSVAA